jgi:putative membrane protein
VVTGIRFGDSLCLFISVPKGSEDYPPTFREAVKNLCAKVGYRRVILVDTHDSIGDTPSRALQSDALDAIKQVASELFSAPQYEINFGFASKQFTFASINGADIGAGGIGCLILEVNGINYAIVSADSNNALVGLRQEMATSLAKESIRLLEFCTSDSHFNAARIRNRRGYLVLGETTPPADIANEVSALAAQARTNMSRASIGFYEWVSHVRLPKADLLGQMEATLTDAINATKRGLLLVFGLLFVELIVLLVF